MVLELPERLPGPLEEHQAAREYAKAQLANLEGHVQSIVERMHVTMPALHDLNESLRTEMVNWLRDLARVVFNILITGADFEATGLMFEATARRRKALGIAQEQSMMSGLHGQQALIDDVRDFFRGHPQEAEMVSQIMTRLMEYQYVMTLGVARGYAREATGDEISDRYVKLQLLLDVLSGNHLGPQPPDVHELAVALGVRLPLAMVTVSVPLGDSAPEQARALVRSNHWSAVGTYGDRVVALTMRPPSSFPLPHGHGTLPATVQPDQIAAAINRACLSADVAQRLQVPSMSSVDAAPFAALLSLPESERQAYVEGCFGDLPSTDRGRSLLSAVAASLTHARLAEAALTLHVHRHTLDYRLRRFTEQTGLDLGDATDRLRCTIALFLVGMIPSSPPSS